MAPYRHCLNNLGDALLVQGGQGPGQHIAQRRQVGGAEAEAVRRQVAAAGHARVQLSQQPPLLPLGGVLPQPGRKSASDKATITLRCIPIVHLLMKLRQ